MNGVATCSPVAIRFIRCQTWDERRCDVFTRSDPVHPVSDLG
jgi:hypothetical protein